MRFSLATRVFVAALVIVLAVCGVLAAVSVARAQTMLRRAAADRVLSVAETLASDPFVRSAVQHPDPSAALEPYAKRVMDTASVDFVTIMNRDRTRYTHPNPAQIGHPYIGTVSEALAGHSQVEQFTGTLGPSVRAIAPVFGASGSVVAMVAVGVTVKSLAVAQAAAIPEILVAAAAMIALGAGGAWLLSRYLRRRTLGYDPTELRSLFAYYHSALHSLREGLILTDAGGRLVLYNDQAADLLGLPPSHGRQPLDVSKLPLPSSLRELMIAGRTATDEVYVTDDRILLVNQQPAMLPDTAADGLPVGTVTTLRDHTDMQALAGERDSMRSLADALRAQAHEHANRLHTIATLIELDRGQEAIGLAVRDRQDAQRLTDQFVHSLDEPFVTALLIGKAAQAHERGIDLTITADGILHADAVDALDLVTITGNLLDNAFDAVAGQGDRRVWADFTCTDSDLIITIADSGPGLPDDDLDAAMRLHATTHGQTAAGAHGYGLALVRQAVSRLRGRIEAESDAGAVFTVTLPLIERTDR